jgi:hypothetical protein
MDRRIDTCTPRRWEERTVFMRTYEYKADRIRE